MKQAEFEEYCLEQIAQLKRPDHAGSLSSLIRRIVLRRFAFDVVFSPKITDALMAEYEIMVEVG